MRYVVLDGYTLNPGDLSWEALEVLGEGDIYDRTNPKDVAQRISGADVVLTNKTILTRQHFEQAKNLHYIGVLATGYNVVNVKAATEHGIVVTNVPAYGTASVAQMTFAHILELCCRVGVHHRTVAEGQWNRCPDFCYWEHPLVELDGMVLGLAGFGKIGQKVAQIGRSFGMTVLVYDEYQADKRHEGVVFVKLDELLRRSDVVSLHYPLTDENLHMIDTESLTLMKTSAFLINTARGPLIDEASLAEALNAGRIAGAGLDVLNQEPPQKDNPLIKAKNCYITPHISWASKAARGRLLKTAVENIKVFLRGESQNVVNSE